MNAQCSIYDGVPAGTVSLHIHSSSFYIVPSPCNVHNIECNLILCIIPCIFYVHLSGAIWWDCIDAHSAYNIKWIGDALDIKLVIVLRSI